MDPRTTVPVGSVSDRSVCMVLCHSSCTSRMSASDVWRSVWRSALCQLMLTETIWRGRAIIGKGGGDMDEEAARDNIDDKRGILSL